jgi:Circularly permutated YpsA SLOG family
MTSPVAIPIIISGGQTGADRAALDWALKHGIPHGGWCPKGRLAEDGPIATAYLLQETPSAEYAQRTEWNVRDSDGTVIFSTAKVLSGGSKTTAELARHYLKPCLHLVDKPGRRNADALRRFVEEQGIKRLNVAGPRASNEPQVRDFVMRTLEAAYFPVNLNRQIN